MKKKNKKIKKIFKIFDIKMIGYDFVKWSGALPVVLYFRLKRMYYTKKEKGLYNGASIIVSNHTGYTDPIVICNTFWLRRVCFVATDYLFRTNFLKLLFNLFRCIPINTSDIAVATFKRVVDCLNHGHCIGLFPEGGIERSDEINSFKSGAVMMALLADCPIIPMYIKKREKWWHRQRVMIGSKIYVKDYIKTKIPTMEDINKVSTMLQEIELNLEKACLQRK